jgi:hypothetical protein
LTQARSRRLRHQRPYSAKPCWCARHSKRATPKCRRCSEGDLWVVKWFTAMAPKSGFQSDWRAWFPVPSYEPYGSKCMANDAPAPCRRRRPPQIRGVAAASPRASLRRSAILSTHRPWPARADRGSISFGRSGIGTHPQRRGGRDSEWGATVTPTEKQQRSRFSTLRGQWRPPRAILVAIQACRAEAQAR